MDKLRIISAGLFEKRKYGLIATDGTVVAELIFDKVEWPGRPNDLPKMQRDGVWYVVLFGELMRLFPAGGSGDRLISSCPQGLQVWAVAQGYLLIDNDDTPAFGAPVENVSFGVPGQRGSISGAAGYSLFNLDCRPPIGVKVQGDKALALWAYVRPDGRPLVNPPRFFGSVHRLIDSHAAVQNGADYAWGKVEDHQC